MARHKLIRNIISKPSEALQAMVDGLLKYSKRKNFRIRMSTFGSIDHAPGNINEYICYGCAATCALQQIANKDLNCGTNIGNQEVRARQLGFSIKDENEFEEAMDIARRGNTIDLFYYFRLAPPNNNNLVHPSYGLQTSDWREQIPEVRRHIRALKAAGY